MANKKTTKKENKKKTKIAEIAKVTSYCRTCQKKYDDIRIMCDCGSMFITVSQRYNASTVHLPIRYFS